MKRGLERRKAERVSDLGVDEKAFRKGQSYLTLVNDLVGGRVLYVAEDRKQFAELRNSGLKTARAWALKETAMSLYSYVYERPARKHFRWWHGWAVRRRLQPMIEVARMLEAAREHHHVFAPPHHECAANRSTPRSSG